ncbi:E3 ubiquitin-protein ligase mib1 [Perkinsus olseni]|uniref:E3 ubiquitin-protein ligase mib1 n=1 Tax=Perkinsus olseni TaxID=32597 RepID=A0A7J6QZ63_PEROL|nr:E3 ubiquitin-protein ligase mib1 [Perkinsus olseni]
MAIEYNKELIKQARLGIMDGEKGVKFLASEVARIQGQDGLNYSEKPYFRSALWEATWKNNEPAVRYLIDKRANINFKDRDGRTPLHEASRYGHAALVELLLDTKADIDATDSAGETPLSQAVSGCRHDVVTLLVSKGAKVHTTDSEGITVQHLAAFAGDPRMADWLFYKGAWKNRYAVEHVDYQEEDSTAGDDLKVAAAPEGTGQAIAQDEGEEYDEEAEVTVDEQA